MAAGEFAVTGDQYRQIDRKMREIKRQLDQRNGSPLDPEWVAKELQRIVEGRKIIQKATRNAAIAILGSDKFIAMEQAFKVWKFTDSIFEPEICYGKDTLCECALENQQGKADWRIVYIHGMSLREQRRKRGTSQSNQPCFCKDNSDWWLESCEDSWATKKMEAGYYLINFQGQFGDMNWEEQELVIATFGDKYERCHEAIFSEAILAIYMINNGERLAEDWWHKGVSLDSDGRRVSVGHFRAYGLLVDGRLADLPDRDLRVSVVRKFDY